VLAENQAAPADLAVPEIPAAHLSGKPRETLNAFRPPRVALLIAEPTEEGLDKPCTGRRLAGARQTVSPR
jgi:hypothetical protein